MIGDHRKSNPLQNRRQIPRSRGLVGKLGGEGGKTFEENLLSARVSCTGGAFRCTMYRIQCCHDTPIPSRFKVYFQGLHVTSRMSIDSKSARCMGQTFDDLIVFYSFWTGKYGCWGDGGLVAS